MATDKKFDLDGFSVSDANLCYSERGYSDGGYSSTLTAANFTNGVSVGEAPDNKTTISSTALSTQSSVVVTHEGDVILSGLPTSDPTNAGQLWSNSGVLTVSAG